MLAAHNLEATKPRVRLALDEPVHALLVMDARVGLLELDPVPDAGRLVVTLRDLIARARTADVPIIFQQNGGPAGSIDEPGTPGWHIDRVAHRCSSATPRF